MRALINFEGEEIIAGVVCRFKNKKRGTYYRLSFDGENCSFIVHRNENKIKFITTKTEKK